MQLTKSNEDYLEAILLLEEKNANVKSVDIANMLGVSKAGVTKAMNILLNLGLIYKEKYSLIKLTEEGKKAALNVLDRHQTIEKFLEKIGVSKDIAKIDCCKIEHVVSNETIECLKKFIK